MVAFRLTTQPFTSQGDTDHRTFYWTRPGKSPSFQSRFGPRLGILGPTDELNADLVRLAVAVRAADMSLGRGSRWRSREFELSVPVSDATKWQAAALDIQRMLGFLTGDTWKLKFEVESLPNESVRMQYPGASQVVLLSGGADSATGALLAARALAVGGDKLALVSHFSSEHLSPIQKSLAESIRAFAPNSLSEHVQLKHGRATRAPNGHLYGREMSSRSRSLLFIALGLAVASVDKVPLLVPENGFASINPPLGFDRRGSLSTKTTHPRFLSSLSEIMKGLGAHAQIENPFADLTKGEMFRLLADEVGNANAGVYLSATNSCAHSGARSFGVYPTVHCGVCFGCILRRASFKAASLRDDSTYLDPGNDQRKADYLGSKSVAAAVRAFVEGPPSELTFAAMRLPADYSIVAAKELTDRAVLELRSYVL